MAEYIDREKLLEELRAESDWNNGDDLKEIQIFSIVGKAPTEDVAPIKHGKWINRGNYSSCSNCSASGTMVMKYCAECGAKMDGGGNG